MHLNEVQGANLLMKQPVQLPLYLIQYLPQIFRIILEVDIIRIDDQQVADVVGSDPLLVALVEPLEVIQAHATLVIAASGLDVVDERGNAGPQVDQQVRRLDLGGHGLEKRGVILEITGGHEPHIVQVRRKNVGIFVDGPVLHNGLITPVNAQYLCVTIMEEIDLQVERPALHIQVEIAEVGIIVRRLIMHFPTEVFAQLSAEGGFASTDVAGYRDVFNVNRSLIVSH